MSEASKKKSAVATKAKEKKVAKAADKKTVATPKNGSTNQYVSSSVNTLLWVLAIVVICGAIFGNYYYTTRVVVDESTLARLTRVAIVIVAMAVGLGLCLFTNKGRSLLTFARQSYTELKKVVWPTRQEAVQTTFIVFVAVSIVSLFLYLCDVIFLELVRLFTV